MLPAGTKFGRYTVVRMLGKGGMGAVYLVRHDVLDAFFALKVLPASVAARNAQFIPRFLREAKLCCKLRHPNLVSVHDAGCDESTGLYYLVMDYAPGGNLRDAMKSAGGALSPEQAFKIVHELSAALVAASDFQLVHRDIKPENIMFGAKGEAKLADLGIAKAADDSSTLLTMDNAVFGTPAYMSPEQACDSGKVDARADIYSLGVVYFEMLCGRRPFEGSSSINVIAKVMSDEPVPDVRKFAPEVEDSVAKVVQDMCEKNVDRRIPSAQALLDRLDAIAGSRTKVGRPAKPFRISPVILFSLLAAFAAVALLGAFGWIAFSPAAKSHHRSPVSQKLESPSKPSPPNQSLTPASSAVPETAAIPAAPSTVVPPARKDSIAVKEQSSLNPTKVVTVLPKPETPATTAPVQEPEPPIDPVLPGGVVVLGGEEDDASALKARFGAAAFRRLANYAHLDEQIDELCESRPGRIYLKPAAAAAEGGMSENGFDNMIRHLANRFRDRGVPFEFVLEPDTPKTRPYNRLIRGVCNAFSYSISEK